ncbi:glutamate-5-semialdehyde dehydrogenase [Rhodotorula toruloides]
MKRYSLFRRRQNYLSRVLRRALAQVARTAKEAFDASQLLDSSERHTALLALKRALTGAKEDILEANRQDIEAAREQVAAGKMSSSLLKRLDLQSSPDKYDSMLQGILDVDSLPDPTGQVTYARKLDEGLDCVPSDTIPVMGHADGLCAVFVDESAVEKKAINVVVDSKAKALELVLICVNCRLVDRKRPPVDLAAGTAQTLSSVPLPLTEESLRAHNGLLKPLAELIDGNCRHGRGR